MFVDDIELYTSVDHSDISSLVIAMQFCVSAVKDSAHVNKLQLSEDKTEAVLLAPSPSAKFPAFLQIGRTCFYIGDSAHNLCESYS